MKRIVTQEDLDDNPALIEQGIKVGDEIDVPAEGEGESEGEGEINGPGGTKPPPKGDDEP